MGCDPKCSACYGPGQEHCTGCNQDMLLLSDHSQCVASCPDGYSADNTGKTCKACHGQCHTCRVGSTSNETCTSCPPHLVMSGNSTCQAQCRGEEYQEGGKCKPCHESCRTCVGGRDTQCGRCKEGFYFERRCVPYCPAGYASDSSRGECLPCPTGCDQCQADGGVCTTCRQGWIKTPEELCLPPESGKCQPGMSSGKGTCLACHDSCKTCVGPKDKDCSACYPDHKLQISTCVLTCPATTKLSSQGHSCLSCPHACASCDSTTCKGCIPGYYLKVDDGSCVTYCRPGQVPDAAGVCQACHSSCQSCFGSSFNQCSACHGDKKQFLSSGQCLDTCPEGSYREGLSYLCKPCHASCTSCTGEGSGKCKACSLSRMLRQGFCVSCERGFFLSHSTSQCHPCHHSCSQCTGPDPNQCMSCQGDLQLDSWSSQCVPCCKEDSPQKSPCCECSAFQSLCTTPARQLRTGFSLAMLGAVWLAAGLLLGGIILFVVKAAESRGGQLGAGVVVVKQTAKYRRVPENTANGHGDGSEEWSDSEEEFLIVNEKTELMEI